MKTNIDNIEKARAVWSALGDIPVNNSNEIELPFMGFGAGTDIYHIWHWIENKYGVTIAEELMQ